MYSSRLPWRLLGLLLLILAPVGAAVTSTSVSTDTDLQTALVDESIHEIIVEQDIEFDSAHWDDWYSRAEPYIRTSNLTIRGFPPLRRLDFAFTGDSRYGLDAGVFLNLSDLVIGHARYGAGVQFDFLAPSPGSYLLLWNSVMIRMACISSTREPDAVAVQPRLPGFPGVQRAVYQDNFCVRRDCFDNVLVYEDYTRITGTSSEDTAAGSYAMVMRNFTKVCRKYIDACDPSQSVDACVRKELDATSDIPTPGQLALAAQKAEQQRRNNTIIGAAVGAVCGAILLLIAAVLLIRRQRRRRRAQEKEQKLLLSVKASPTTVQASPATDSSPDLELGIVDPARNSPANPKLMVAPGTPPNRHNSWELAACKTSERFLHSQNNSSSDVAQHWLSGSNAGGNSSWYMRGSGSSATGALHSHDGAPSTADMIAGNAGNDRVTLGILLGAGSFGRVYKGKWRGMDVAVKVLQHSRAAAASVANEVDLMMSFQHPHIVSAHHFVSWRKRNPPKVAAFDTVANDVTHPSSWAAGIDNSFADTAGPTGEYPEDTQTWIVQEFCDAGNLCEYLTSRGDWQEGQLPDGHSMLKLLFRLREVADGMSYLHRHTVVHGDLKSGNVLLTTSRTAPYGRIAKITDFGLSRAMATGQTHRSTHTLGTVSHMAPELLRYGKMAPSCDVFSFGIMMWELLTSRIAFSGLHYGAIIERVALMGERPTVPSGTPEDYSLLMGSCWSADPEQRPTFDQVVRCLDIMITSRQQELAVAKSGSTANNDSTNSETQQALLLAGQSTGAPTGPPTAPINQQQLNRAISNSSGEFDMSTRGHSSSRYASTRSGQGAVPPTPDVGPGQGARSASGYLGSFGPQDL